MIILGQKIEGLHLVRSCYDKNHTVILYKESSQYAIANRLTEPPNKLTAPHNFKEGAWPYRCTYAHIIEIGEHGTPLHSDIFVNLVHSIKSSHKNFATVQEAISEAYTSSMYFNENEHSYVLNSNSKYKFFYDPLSHKGCRFINNLSLFKKNPKAKDPGKFTYEEWSYVPLNRVKSMRAIDLLADGLIQSEEISYKGDSAFPLIHHALVKPFCKEYEYHVANGSSHDQATIRALTKLIENLTLLYSFMCAPQIRKDERLLATVFSRIKRIITNEMTINKDKIVKSIADVDIESLYDICKILCPWESESVVKSALKEQCWLIGKFLMNEKELTYFWLEIPEKYWFATKQPTHSFTKDVNAVISCVRQLIYSDDLLDALLLTCVRRYYQKIISHSLNSPRVHQELSPIIEYMGPPSTVSKTTTAWIDKHYPCSTEEGNDNKTNKDGVQIHRQQVVR